MKPSSPDPNGGPEPYEPLARIVADLEAALKAGGFWEERAPPEAALQSILPFCVDTLAFTAWLQWVFIPRVYRLIDEREALPPHSDILPYAEECLSTHDSASGRILEVVGTFDAFINDTAERNAVRH